MNSVLSEVQALSDNQKPLYNKRQLQSLGRDNALKKYGTQLPAHFFLMMTEYVYCESDGGDYGKGIALATYDLDPENVLFRVHFPGNPVMPAVMMLEGIQQAVGLTGFHRGCRGSGYVASGGEFAPVHKVTPENTSQLRCEVHVKRIRPTGRLQLILADGIVCNQDDQEVFWAHDIKIVFAQ